MTLLGILMMLGLTIVLLAEISRRGAFAALLRRYGECDWSDAALFTSLGAPTYELDGWPMRNLHAFRATEAGLMIRVRLLPFFHRPAVCVPWRHVYVEETTVSLFRKGRVLLGAHPHVVTLGLHRRAYRQLLSARDTLYEA